MPPSPLMNTHTHTHTHTRTHTDTHTHTHTSSQEEHTNLSMKGGTETDRHIRDRNGKRERDGERDREGGREIERKKERSPADPQQRWTRRVEQVGGFTPAASCQRH